MRISSTSARQSRGITIAEVLVALVAVIALLSMMAVGGGGVQPADKTLKCARNLNQMHKGLILYANDFGGAYPKPLKISAETAAANPQSGNSTANIFSYMIFNTYYSPDVVVCPDESSPNISAKKDYRYGTIDDSGWNEKWLWDPAFSSDMTKPDANSSYANLAMIGERTNQEWSDTLNQKFAVLSDRGPKDGEWDDASLTLKRHGSADEWAGNVAFNDGHVQIYKFKKDDAEAFKVNGDNLFCQDDELITTDMWLGVFGPTDEKTTKPYWD